MDKFAFGKLLTKLRQRDNMTQSDLADALNVSVSAVSKWETGKNFPDIPVFAELKKLFGLSYDDLYHPEQTMIALEAGTLTSVEERTVSSDAAATAARKNHLAVRLLSLLLALVLGLNAFFLIREVFFSPADAAEPSAYWVYASESTYDDKVFQEVHEIYLVAEHPEKITDEIWQDEFYRYAEDWWKENSDTEIHYLWIYAYDNVDDAKKKTEPVHSGYTYFKVGLE